MMGLPVTGRSRTSLDTKNPPRFSLRRRRSATCWVRDMRIQVRTLNHQPSRTSIGKCSIPSNDGQTVRVQQVGRLQVVPP